jgi:hypothetical protein
MRSSRALTFLELLIALSITAVTCAILAVLVNATAVGTNSQNDGRRSLVRLQSVKSALLDELVNARAVLAVGTNYVVYWEGDQPGAVTSANNAVNYSEMRLLELDTGTGNLNLYKVVWPANSSNSWIISYDATCPVSTNWYATCQALKATSYYPPITVATGVTSLTVSLDSATTTSAHLVSFCISTNDGSVNRQLAFSVMLVSPLSPS